ncbi:Synaptotagmin-11 Synaptotagmin XI [Larimichthys crocea]|uniref:Synaptotagmin-11 Synaptotagmin XI n=1 Tax=Larimichthys crocea TaxID=215358 RepID=A0A6G0ICW9_LARCR|nr:Synaptotagmin-11 Synaptotagmin XI [Larimichthys crocea]
MADIIELGPAYAMSPVLAGFLGAGVLVLVVVVLVLLWSFCQRRYLRISGRYKLHGDRYCDAEDPPYKFIHMLKGISIYPESLSSSKRIVRGIRRADRSDRDGERGCPATTGRGMVLVDAENNILDVPGQLQMSHLVPPAGSGPAHSQARLERALPVRADYCCLDSSSASSSQTSSKTASPFTPPHRDPEPEPSLAPSASPSTTTSPRRRGGDHRRRPRPARHGRAGGQLGPSLPELTLHFLVLSFDRFARDDVMGRCGAAERRGPEHGPGPPEHSRSQRGTCSVRLVASCWRLCPTSRVSHRLSVVVLKARTSRRWTSPACQQVSGPEQSIVGICVSSEHDWSALCNVAMVSPVDPYVKVNVFYGRKRIAKKKTHVKKCTLNPVFNESFIYDIPPELLPEISVEFLVVDFDRTTKNEVLGRLLLGLHSPAPSGATHWREVCENPRRQISKWHNLSEY